MQEYVVWISWYDPDINGNDYGYMGLYDGEASRFCTLGSCKRFPSKEAADKWIEENEDELYGDVHGFLDWHVMTFEEAQQEEAQDLKRLQMSFFASNLPGNIRIATAPLPEELLKRVEQIGKDHKEYSMVEIMNRLVLKGLQGTGY